MTAPDTVTLEETISLWSEHYGVDFDHRAATDLAAMLRQSPEAMWRDGYVRERAARLDAEARLRGMRWWLGAALAAGLTVIALAGCLRATNDVSRAVARWEVRDGDRQ